jgi:hypothetical protein
VDTEVDRIRPFRLAAPMEEAKQLARCLVCSTALLQGMMPRLRNLRDADAVRQRVRKFHCLESEADRIGRQALVRLFDANLDPIHVIKWKIIIRVLESATDKCEDCANVIEGIVLKHG